MSRWKRPLTAKEVRQIVKALGFEYRNSEGGHENWIRNQPPPFRKVTIDGHLAPFGHTLVLYMSRQAGVSVREFYETLK